MRFNIVIHNLKFEGNEMPQNFELEYWKKSLRKALVRRVKKKKIFDLNGSLSPTFITFVKNVESMAAEACSQVDLTSVVYEHCGLSCGPYYMG